MSVLSGIVNETVFQSSFSELNAPSIPTVSPATLLRVLTRFSRLLVGSGWNF